MRNRVESFFSAWYIDQRKYRMSQEDWHHCAYMLLSWIWSFVLGLAIGFIWIAVL
jgi:hypothetical protein